MPWPPCAQDKAAKQEKAAKAQVAPAAMAPAAKDMTEKVSPAQTSSDSASANEKNNEKNDEATDRPMTQAERNRQRAIQAKRRKEEGRGP